MPIFQSVSLQQWNINLNAGGIYAHTRVGLINADTNPSQSALHPLDRYIRDPNN